MKEKPKGSWETVGILKSALDTSKTPVAVRINRNEEKFSFTLGLYVDGDVSPRRHLYEDQVNHLAELAYIVVAFALKNDGDLVRFAKDNWCEVLPLGEPKTAFKVALGEIASRGKA